MANIQKILIYFLIVSYYAASKEVNTLINNLDKLFNLLIR